MFDTKKVMSIALVLSMLCASIAIVSQSASSIDVGGDVVTSLAKLPNGVKINDVAWNTNGSMAMAVGHNESGGSNAFWYYPKNDTWVGLTPYCVEVPLFLVFGPATGGETDFTLGPAPVYNHTIYKESGPLIKLTVGVDYSIDVVTGNFILTVPLGFDENVHAWYNYSQREFFGVDYDSNATKFGLVGTNPEPTQSAALYTNPGDPVLYEISHNGAWPSQDLKDLTVDIWGNMLAVGPNDLVLFYRLNDDTWYTVNDADDSGWHYESVDFELENKRFYLVGGNGAGGVVAYTDPLSSALIIPVSHTNYDTVANMTRYPIFRSIAWINDPAKWNGQQYAMLVGGSNLTVITTHDDNATMFGTEIPSIELMDVAFDKSTWKDGSIIGLNQSSGAGYIFHYSPVSNDLMMLHAEASQMFYCVDYCPPSSPSFGFVVGSTGGSIININSFDMSTKLTINTDFPHITNNGMWKQSDGLFGVSTFNTQVNVDTNYTFFVEVNYTIDGVNKFWDNDDNIRVQLWAWYDEGKIGTNSEAEPTWATVDNRTRQFSLTWNEGLSGGPDQGNAAMDYPIASPGTDEFRLDDWWVDPNGYGADGFSYRLFFNVTFDRQTWAADGTGFANGASSNINNQIASLDDPNSWDVRFQIWDQTYVSALNESYEEFGIYRFTNVTVANNPVGSAPPGTNGVPLGPNSQVTYSANIDHYLNMSIEDLERTGGGVIPAINISANIVSPLANDINSQLNNTTYMPGPLMEICIWGNTTQPFADWMMAAPLNGTNAHGPWGSDFNSMGATEISWYADIPAGIPEGVYETFITFTIGYY
ncbi:MAG: hypothetical protein KAS67_01725 [Thermoplasmata archaeon]|nr:hypothetical protein [Thermoplasmata archaeon]